MKATIVGSLDLSGIEVDEYDLYMKIDKVLGRAASHRPLYQVNLNYRDDIQEDLVMEAGRHFGAPRSHVQTNKGMDSKFLFRYKEDLEEFIEIVKLLGYSISISSRLIEVQMQLSPEEVITFMSGDYT